jgi:sec-independent protein translocase protein TatA
MLGSIGPTELILILLIVLILFGGKKLGNLGKSLGEGIKNFKDSMNVGKEGKKDDPPKNPQPPVN